tara:strand:+ start:4828 stop:5349 length:522 start_codon:yes stop_codon:yes gene_type:complete
MTGRQLTHYPKDHLKEDGLDDIREPLSKALNLTPDDFDRMSPEVKNLLSGRRNLGVTWLDDYEVVVEVVSNERCACGVSPGQKTVFDMRHRIKPEKSDAPMCMHMLAPILPIFYMTFDRASEGLNPLTRIWNHYECGDTGDDDGASKARTLVYLRRSDTHEIVTDPAPGRGEA